MITNKAYPLNSKHYVYRHIRKDLNMPFYIGIGTVNSAGMCYRAFSLKRSSKWKEINNTADVEVQIIYESDYHNEILEKEIELIKLYGRADLNEGCLCNLRDGGDTGYGWVMSETTRENFRKRQTGVKLSEKTLKNMSIAQKNRYIRDGVSKICKKIYQYNVKGEYLREWASATHAAKEIYTKDASVHNALLKNKNNFFYSYFWFNEYKGLITDVNKKAIVRCKINQFDLLGNFIKQHASIKDAVLTLPTKKNRSGINQIAECCKGKRDSYLGFKWGYIDE